MTPGRRRRLLPRRIVWSRASRCGVAAVLLGLILALGGSSVAAGSQQLGSPSSSRAAAVSASEFSRIIREFSEEGGYFFADNFTSNETGYLQVVTKLKDLGVSGGAYIGVGPEQNFTYIAKIRPSIAFIVDIRRQAMLQHLLYKAIFHRAEDRAEFLSWLFSKPLSATREETKGSLEELLRYIFRAPTKPQIFAANLAAIRKTIEQDFRFPLSAEDSKTLEYIYSAFWENNLRIGYGYGPPSLADLILVKDLEGNLGNFLAREDDYRFVRELQVRNRVIPVVGDFAGPKALAAVAEYLKKNDYTVSAFYTSNVEEYLFANRAFRGFANNVRRLPISDRSVLIRALKPDWSFDHPARVPGANRLTLLQKISVFLEDDQKGLYPDYYRLIQLHYIGGRNSPANARPAPASR